MQASRYTNHSFQFYMSESLVENSYAITFGSPQVIQRGMTERLAMLMRSHHLAIVHGNDPVARLPGKAASLFDLPVQDANWSRMSAAVARAWSWLASPWVNWVQSY